MVGGPSGSGKSRWLFQFLRSWSRGEPIFNYPSYPVPFRYISLDRSERSILRTLKKMNIPEEEIPRFNVYDDPTLESINQICCKVKECHPEAKLYVMEGIAGKVPGHKVNDYGEVAKFLTSLAHWCESEDVTIIGVVHAAKTKANETYENPRQRLLGSVAWAAFSETIIGFEPVEAKNPECKLRRLYLLPRNEAEQTFDLEMQDGILLPATAETLAMQKQGKRGPKAEKLQTAIEDIQIYLRQDRIKETSLTEITAAISDTAPTTLRRAIGVLVEGGFLRPRKKGVYTVISPFNDPLVRDMDELPAVVKRQGIAVDVVEDEEYY